jgi:hypothetical protein
MVLGRLVPADFFEHFPDNPHVSVLDDYRGKVPYTADPEMSPVPLSIIQLGLVYFVIIKAPLLWRRF